MFRPPAVEEKGHSCPLLFLDARGRDTRGRTIYYGWLFAVRLILAGEKQ